MSTSAGNSDGKVRVAYFDDRLLFREALAVVLEESGVISVTQSTGHRGYDIRTLLDSPLSAILVALDAQTHDPMVTVREIHQALPELPMCALVKVDHLDRAREALAAGCKGAVSTSAALTMLVSALENLARGQAFVDPTLGGPLLARSVARTAGSRHQKNGSRENYSSGTSEISKN